MHQDNFVAYEYLNQTVSAAMQNTYVDGYANFGWQLQERKAGTRGVALVFKRDRAIAHKTELNRLQKTFDQQMARVTRLERTKRTGAQVVGLSVGIIGAAFMAGSVFAWEAALVVLSIILAVPGFLAWGTAYLAFRWWQGHQAQKVDPLIDDQYDAIAETSKAAFALLR